jgi:AraC-like DNA-binding protein
MAETKPSPHTVTLRGVPRVIDLGSVRDTPGHAERLLDFWVLGILLGGRIGIEVGSEQLTVSSGDYYLLHARVLHRGLDTARFDCIFFHFVPSAQPTVTPRFVLGLTGETSPTVNYYSLFKLLEDQYRTGLLDGDELGVQLLAILGQVTALQRQRSAALADPAHALATSVLELLRTEYAKDLSGAIIADRLGYSYAYLERVFRASYQHSIHQELLRARVQAAAHGLRMGKSIKNVAHEVGFADYYYFLKVFKRVKGVSPGVFQASHRPR